MRKILVTGGAGFIGSHLVDELAADSGNQVVVLDNLRRGKLRNLEESKDRITFIEADIRDRAAMERAVAGVDTVFHLAAQSNVIGAVTDPDYSFSTNVQGTFEVLRAAAASLVRRLVFTSSREVYGDAVTLPVLESAPLAPKNAYGASKAAGEMYCRVLSAGQFAARIVRLANVYGTRDFGRVIPIFVEQALKNEPLTLFGGRQILDFIWIDEVVKGLITAANLAEFSGPINMGSGKPAELKNLTERVVRVTGSRSEIRVLAARDGEVARFVASTALQEKVLGLQTPEDPLDQLPKILEYFSKRRFH